MSNNKIVSIRKYRQDLIERAEKENSLDDLLSDVNELVKLFQIRGLEDFFSRTSVADSEKFKLVVLIQGECSEILDQFFTQITTNGDYDLLYDVLLDVLYQSQFVTGEFDLSIKTVVPITEEQRERMLRLAQKKLRIQIRQIDEVIDPSILGGFILEANHKVIDASVKTQLQKARNKIL
ncbi:F-type H+-transporting ATPase subunit delta [Streptococcus henryi]|jgi:F-type H+-transporting ATPase subunit delta|uniref:ATP synthase subunit delta n=1 Tax=Streptococcus henryi TaxID=439219 RepID=A0A1G6AVV7_9STRE|nr:F0F1 ATP synthase subunit delta [Streptococcus henryi]SDB12495.1 F-type H+-transporting ATPase subunit delta [Streptococcus henryi]